MSGLIGACLLLVGAGTLGARAQAQGMGDLIGGGGVSVDSLVCGLTGQTPSDQWNMPVPIPSRPFIGFNEDAVAGIHGIAPVDYVGHVRTIGGNVLRTNIDWRNAEPRRDCWSNEWWARWRDLYAAAIPRGVRPVFIISGAPAWARGTEAERGCSGYVGCSFPPSREMDAEWAEFAAEVASRFPQALIEVWNEPNIRAMWSSGPDPERFAELVVLAHDAIKSVSPNTEVVAGGLLSVRRFERERAQIPMREFLTRTYAASPSIEGHFDYLGLHPYTTRARIGRQSAFARALRGMRAIRDANADRTPILVTEFGISTASPGVDETRQTLVLDRVHDLLLGASDVAGVIYHRVIEPKDTTQDSLEIGYAWLRHGRTPPEPRPVYCHFAKRAGHTYKGC